MSTDLSKIRVRLAAATPGPWHAWDRGIGYEVHKGAERDCLSEYGVGLEHCAELNDGFRETFSRSDADLIAHAPTDLAELCDRAERAEAAVERVRALHPACRWYTDPCDDPECDREHADIDGYDLYHDDEFRLVCETCSGGDLADTDDPAPYPCPTLRALDGAS